jgi:hypothetical protein
MNKVFRGKGRSGVDAGAAFFIAIKRRAYKECSEAAEPETV